MTETHVIQQQIVELSADRQWTAELGQAMVHRAWDERLVPVIDRAFSRACPDDDTIVIDRLELDLGVLPLDGFEDVFAERLEQLLRERLAEQVDRHSAATGPVSDEAQWPASRPPRVLYFLREGRLPWWSPETTRETLGRELDEIIAGAPEALARWFVSTGPEPRIARRLVEQFGAARAEALTTLIARDVTAVVRELAAMLEQAALPASLGGQALPALLWEVAWAALGRDAGLAERAAQISDAVLARIAGALPATRRAPLGRAMAEVVAGLTGSPPGPAVKSRLRDVPPGGLEVVELPADRPAPRAPSRGAKSIEQTSPRRSRPDTDTGPDGTTRPGPPHRAGAPKDRTGQSPPESQASEAEDRVPRSPDDAVEPGRAPKSATPDSESQEYLAPPRSPPRPDGPARRSADTTEGRPAGPRGAADQPHQGAEMRPETPGPSTEAVSPPSWWPLFDTTAESAATPVGNAGLVLLWPFLGRLFQALGYVEKGLWLSDEAPIRAVHLLQFLATGDSETPEYLLVLNKLLCGLPVYEPVPYALALDEREREEGIGLLRAAIEHWSALKNTSVDGLRQAFLQRAGLIELAGDNWLLQVEREAHDVLLERLPWGLAMVRLSWMHTTLEVKW